MKILHTSDWHLGHTLYNYDRMEEQSDMLRQMVEIVKVHQPDLFLLAGDVFHTSQPSSAAQKMFAEALVAIHDANPQMTIVATAGNHDSSSKHEIFRTPWEALKVYTIGNLSKENLDDHIIEIPGKGYVVAVPYAYERNIPDGFFQQLLDTVAAKNSENLPVIMTAHTTVKGCDFTGHDNSTENTIGGIDSIDIKEMGEGYDYLALGHIHHEQFVHTGKHNVRYSGTPIAVSFDENYPHSVSIVDIAKHGDRPSIEKVAIKNCHPLVTLPIEGLATWDEAKKLFADFPNDIPAYIRLNVEVDDMLPPNANNEARAIANGKECKFCIINTKRKERVKTEAKALSIQEFQAESPLDIAMHYANDKNRAFDDEIKDLFNEVIRVINEEARNK
ncbi:MAG: exonuclease SbcCD subunit D [Muribaculaceae bacterium]|nr:exonuclease SbcCD subunit D [Muribaculaceae bacterium]